MRIHLNIGSNLGDRAANLRRAVEALGMAFPEGEMRVSRTVESEPWGYDSDNAFLNVGVMIDLEESRDPHEVLRRVQEAERSVSVCPHRDASGGYADRVIDIDIIDIDRMRLESEELTLPHPRMMQREFVIGPLRELDPGFFNS